MQRPDENKKRRIQEIAAKLFAVRPFHEVRLDDVATAAGVGKGTLYIYFKSKEDLYLSLVEDGFLRLIQQLKEEIADDTPPAEALEKIVRGVVRSAQSHPEFFKLVREAILPRDHVGMTQMFREVVGLIERTLRRGIEAGLWCDEHPELTAVLIPGLVRSALLHGPTGLGEEVVSRQIVRLLRCGLCERETR